MAGREHGIDYSLNVSFEKIILTNALEKCPKVTILALFSCDSGQHHYCFAFKDEGLHTGDLREEELWGKTPRRDGGKQGREILN